jgi:hypothetical protein
MIPHNNQQKLKPHSDPDQSIDRKKGLAKKRSFHEFFVGSEKNLFSIHNPNAFSPFSIVILPRHAYTSD